MWMIRTLPSSRAVFGLATTFLLFAPLPLNAQTPSTERPSQRPATGGAPPTQRPGDLPSPIQRPRATPPLSITSVEPQLFEDARAIALPGERALALARIAEAAVFSNQLEMAHTAVMEGGEAARLEPVPIVRDQRIRSIIKAALLLAEERMREPLPSSIDPYNQAPAPPAPEQGVEVKLTAKRREQLRLASEEWRSAARLAREISDIVTRTEASHRVVEAASFAMLSIRGEPVRLGSGPAKRPPISPEARDYVRRVLEQAAEEAARIERPVWRDRSLVSVAQNAAASDEFGLAIRVARMIPQPEIRTDALLRIAENEALTGRPREATEAYAETAATIAMIPLDDPREVLAGVLIDSLISLGRFDDARASTVLYARSERRVIALSAVAESQGFRGLSTSARKWIANEPIEHQSLYYRKLNDGMLNALERNRGKDLGRGIAPSENPREL